MQRANELNINSRTYWNDIYGTAQKREQYASQGTDYAHSSGKDIKPTMRFAAAVDEIKDGDTVLDIGCGVGVFTTLVKKVHPTCEVWGTDISDKAMHDNTMQCPQIKYLHQYVGSQDLVPDAYFDVVFAGEILEHLEDPNDLFKDAFRVLKPGGRFICTTPREEHIKSPEHTWYFTQEDVEKLYADNGFTRVRNVYLPDMEHLLVIFQIGRKP